jgi:phosphoribosylaminoimidazolecarboxamide formyltransferase / IMP cyclohydrolase
MGDLCQVRRALVSVSDKSGLTAFVQGLASLGVEIISTGGTAAAIASAGVPVTPIEKVTGFPEIMDGRVKTLHPAVHGGILGVRESAAHREAMARHGITPIDLVCVNLYPFEQTVAKPGCSREDAIEQIDIGGPAMLRSAAKNHEGVVVVPGPAFYERVLGELRQNRGATTLALRQELARETFAVTARYDAAIACYLSSAGEAKFPHLLNLAYAKAEDLRYGENPHQAAALYRRLERDRQPCVAQAEQLHGKELSYNNIIDAQAAWSLALTLRRVAPGSASAVIVKHTNPCGAATAPTLRAAVDAALAGDPVAAYGGIMAVSRPFDALAAERLNTKEVFLEVIVAPWFEPEALAMLRARWTGVRLLATGEGDEAPAGLEVRSIPGGLLAQERDTRLAGELVLRAGPGPGPGARRAAAMLEGVVKFLFSNAVVIGGEGGEGVVRVYGSGAGQMDRVASCRLAVEKAGKMARGAVCVSDAFFPFPDGPEVLIDAGVSVIVHPGGSKRDQETFDLCRARGVSCLTTGLRHFRH